MLPCKFDHAKDPEKAMTTTDIPPPQVPHNRRWRFFRSVSALILREMATSYGRSPGGYLWALLEPIAGIALLTFVFSLMIRTPALGSNFPLFYATGLLPFTMYMHVSNQMAQSINYSKPLLGYPAVTFLDALVARFLLNTLTHLLVMAIILWSIIAWYDLKLILNWAAIFEAVTMAISMAIGMGTLNCYLSSRYMLWARLWAVFSRPQFLLAGVFFLADNLPAQFRDIFMYNPLAHVVMEMRRGFYATYDGVYASPLYVYVVALVLTIFGLFLLLRNHKLIAEL
jgi:capsular polysaccharide transport system permease protein